ARRGRRADGLPPRRLLATDGHAAREAPARKPPRLGERAMAQAALKPFAWDRCNVLVTGATGLLGGWLLEELLRRGATVTCLVRDHVPRARAVDEGALARANVVRGDLEERDVVLRALNEYEIDTVFHVGAQTIVGAASRAPLSTFESNVRGTW